VKHAHPKISGFSEIFGAGAPVPKRSEKAMVLLAPEYVQKR